MTAASLVSPVALAAPELVVGAVADGRRIGLQLHYVAGASEKLGASGAWWFAPARQWVWPQMPVDKQLEVLRGVYQGHHVDIDAAGPVLRAALEAPEEGYFSQRLDVQVFPLAHADNGSGLLAVSFSYDVPCAQAMRSLGARYHPKARAWQVNRPRSAVDQVLQALQSLAGVDPAYVFVHEQPVVLEDLTEAGRSASPLVVPAATPERSHGGAAGDEEGGGFITAELDDAQRFEVDEAALASLAASAGLRDYQVQGVRHLIGQSGACLGDDMGLGKTRQCVVSARLIAGQGRVLVLCPASLRINWKREIEAVFPKAAVGLVGETPHEGLYRCDWVVANYERLGGLVRDPALSFAAMFIDEAHYLKEHQAGRTRNAFVMATRIARRYVVTGTPLLNREVELHTLLRVTGHALGGLSLREFTKQFAGDKARRAALADNLRGWMLRRSKSVLKDLGTKTRQVRYISPAEGLGAYQQIYNDMSLQAMPKIVKLRQALERLKTPFLIETVESLSEGDKIIVFCEYMATVQLMQSAFVAAGICSVLLVGSDSSAKRQRAIDSFQNDPTVTVFIGTTSAAGVGITLTAANYVVFASLPWTPALMRQAEDRAYRLGQRRNVIVIAPLIERTIDMGVWELLTTKQETEDDVVEAVRSALPGTLTEGMAAGEISRLHRYPEPCQG